MQTDKPMLTARYAQAMTWAAEIHARQERKGSGVPYLAHLLSVSALVLEDGGSEDEAIAALLHDSIEDQGIKPDEIRDKFGSAVADIVVSCSDTDQIPKPPWRERKERYLAHLRHASPGAMRVSLADKLHNARSILLDYQQVRAAIWNRFKVGREESLWYYRAVCDAVDGRYHGSLLEELRFTVERLEGLP